MINNIYAEMFMQINPFDISFNFLELKIKEKHRGTTTKGVWG